MIHVSDGAGNIQNRPISAAQNNSPMLPMAQIMP